MKTYLAELEIRNQKFTALSWNKGYATYLIYSQVTDYAAERNLDFVWEDWADSVAVTELELEKAIRH